MAGDFLAMGVCRSIGPSGEARYWRTDVLSWETASNATRATSRTQRHTTPPPLLALPLMFPNVLNSGAVI